MSSTTYKIAGIRRKKVLQNIKKIAAKLPLTYYKAKQYSYKKGHEILADKSLEAIHHSITEPDEVYKVEYEVMPVVNHAKRMKTLLQRNGVQAVQKYITEIQKFATEMANNELPFVINDMDLWIKAHIIKDFLNTKNHRRKKRRRA